MALGQNCCCLTKGVFNRNDPVPLKSVSVDVRIEGFIANVRSTLCYKNVEKNPIEVRYEFPMDDQSTVYHFEAQIEDRIILAECQEKKQATETYDDAVKAGFSAVLMQEDYASDVFSCLVGNLPPDTDAIIKFGYVTELSLQPDGTLSFLLPTLLNPRYNPSVETGVSKCPVAYVTELSLQPDETFFLPSLLNPQYNPSLESGGLKGPIDDTYVPVGGEQPYKFEIKATVVNPGKIVSVKSPKDELNVKLSDDKTEAQVTLGKPFVADHDFKLDVTFEELNKPHLIIEKGDDAKDGILKKDVIMVNFFPELKDADYTSKHEFIFVIDRSGSMQGTRIGGAKETLLLFLKSLPTGCYFNVVGFGSTFQFLFPDGSREYSEESLKVACEYQQRMGADLGGTEILAPLKHIYDKPPMATHSREILLFTDGEVVNTETVIELVKKNASNTRLFSFGIGEGASTSLVKGIARAGQGKAEFTKDGERLQPLVVKTLKAAMQLAVTDLHLDWQFEGGSCDLIQMPRDLPPLFAGERLIIYYVNSADKPVLSGKAQLKGRIGERSLELGLDLDASKDRLSKDETMPIHRLAAKAQIKQLQDSGKDENKTSIVLLSTAANVISCHTSMVGIDKNRKEKVVGDLMHRNVPRMSDSSGRRIMPMTCGSPVAMSGGSAMLMDSLSARLMARRSAASSKMVQADSPLMSRIMSMTAPPPPATPPQPTSMPAAFGGGTFATLSGGGFAASGGGTFAAFGGGTFAASGGGTFAASGGDTFDLFGSDTFAAHRGSSAKRKVRAQTVQGQPKEPTYMIVVALQTFSGLWKLNAELAAVLKTTLDALQNASPVKAFNVWATVLALSYLEVKYGDKRDEWEMVEMKARQWLDLQHREGLSIDDLLQKAKAVVGQL